MIAAKFPNIATCFWFLRNGRVVYLNAEIFRHRFAEVLAKNGTILPGMVKINKLKWLV